MQNINSLQIKIEGSRFAVLWAFEGSSCHTLFS